MRVIEKTVYQYDELSDKAKEKAREWYRQLVFEDSCDWECVISDFVEIAKILGIEVDTHDVRTFGGTVRQKPSVWFSLSYSQGDYASFDGSYSYAKGSSDAIRKQAPKDTKLHEIADELAAIQKRNFYRLEATIKSSNHGRVDVEVYDREYPFIHIGSHEDHVRDCMKDLCRWLYRSLQNEYEYQTSDEAVVEAIKANEYEFYESGKRYI